MTYKEAIEILRRASPHGWVEIGTRQPEPSPLRGTVSLSTPGREPRANEAGAIVLAAASEREQRMREALAPFARAYWARISERNDRPIMTVWDEQGTSFVLTAGDFHRAADALSEPGPAGPGRGAEHGS